MPERNPPFPIPCVYHPGHSWSKDITRRPFHVGSCQASHLSRIFVRPVIGGSRWFSADLGEAHMRAAPHTERFVQACSHRPPINEQAFSKRNRPTHPPPWIQPQGLTLVYPQNAPSIFSLWPLFSLVRANLPGAGTRRSLAWVTLASIACAQPH